MVALTLTRDIVTEKSVTGRLFVDGQFECYTLEDPPRATKIAGVTAIPVGVYVVILSYSPRFKCVMPEITGVPGFTGVRIHTGNIPEDTDGCVLVGKERAADRLSGSRLAYAALLPKLVPGPISLTITQKESPGL